MNFGKNQLLKFNDISKTVSRIDKISTVEAIAETRKISIVHTILHYIWA